MKTNMPDYMQSAYEYTVSRSFKMSQRYFEGDLILQRYRIIDTLNKDVGNIEKSIYVGGMGCVYHCLDTHKNREVALKSVKIEFLKSEDIIGYFFEECENWINIGKNPYIAEIIFIESIDNYPYIITEWVKGNPRYGNSL